MSNFRHILFYDSDCPFCQFQVRALARMDWFNKVDFVPSKNFHQLRLGVHIDDDDLNQAIHCVTPNKAVYRGARAIRFLGFRMPLLVPLALFMWFPGMIFVSDKIYWIGSIFLSLSTIFISTDISSSCKTLSDCNIVPDFVRPK